MKKILISLILITSSYASIAGSVTWVRASGGCDHTTLQAAVNDLSADEIRIVGNLIENVLITRSVNVKGGYASCGASQPTTVSQINGTNALLPTVRVRESNPTANNVILQNLTLINGTGGYTGFEGEGGGLSIIGGAQTVTVNNSVIFNNSSLNAGGGVSVRNRATLNLIDTAILLNSALTKGGGIYCKESDILALGSTTISKNEVDGNNSVGGGVYLERCDFEYQANEPYTFFGTDYNGISDNKAKTNGAGIYAIGKIVADPLRFEKSTISLGPSSSHPSTPPVLVNDNEITGPASSNASAIWLYTNHVRCGYSDNLPSCSDYNQLEMQNVELNGNQGGKHMIYIGYLSKLNVHCDDYAAKSCNQISNNSAESLITYSMNTASTLENLGNISHRVVGANIRNNTVDRIIWGLQKLVFTTDNHPVYENSNWQSSLSMSRSIIHHNGPLDEVALAIERTNMHFDHVTIANNTYASSGAAVFENELSTNPIEIPAKVNSLFEITSTIISEPNVAVFNSGFDNIDFSCVMYTFGVFGNVSNVDGQLASDPGFVNPASADYHLLQNSPAVDYCDDRGNQGLVNAKDIDGEAVGWNDTNTVDNLGTYDLGADELHYTIGGNSADVAFSNANVSSPASVSYIEDEQVTFTIVIANNGPDTANNVQFGAYPTNMKIDSVTSEGSCNDALCAGFNMINGYSETVIVKATILNPGSFTMYMQMFANESDPVTNHFYSFNDTAAINPDIIFKDAFE